MLYNWISLKDYFSENSHSINSTSTVILENLSSNYCKRLLAGYPVQCEIIMEQTEINIS